MLKVLQVISDFDVGGAGRYLITLLKQDAFRELEVKVACPGGGALARNLASLGVEVLDLEQADRSFTPSLLRQLFRLLRRYRFDVVHTHASLAGRIAARLAGYPAIVLTRHGLGSRAFRGPAFWLNRLAGEMLTDRIIAISGAVRDHLVAGGISPERVTVIHNGVDLREFPPGLDPRPVREELGLGTGPVVGMIARLVPEKGHDYLLLAARQVVDRLPEARFLLVGDGPERDRLSALARQLGLEAHVLFAGFRPDIPQVVAAQDLAVLSSTSEGLGLVLLEAMAGGKPVVATRVGGIPEVVEDGYTGILVPPRDPSSLARAILGLLEDREMARRMGLAGRQRVEKKFDARGMAAATVAQYRQLVGR